MIDPRMYAPNPYQNYQPIPAAFVEHLQKAINGEASAIQFYGELLQLNEKDRMAYDNVKHAYDDEHKHFKAFTALYVKLTGKQPLIEPKPTKFTMMADAYRFAFFDELEAADLYKEMYLQTPYTPIRDIFFMAKSDEIEHAQRFNFLYNRAIRMKQ